MSLVQTLDDLKKEVTLEAEQSGNAGGAVEPDVKADASESPAQKQTTESATPDEVPAFLRTDEPASDGQVPVAVHVRELKKLKQQRNDRDDEIETLKAQVVALQAAQQKPVEQTQQFPTPPDQYDFDGVGDPAYQAAMAKYVQQVATSQAPAPTQAQQPQAPSMDDHWTRAGNFINEFAGKGVTMDKYQNAAQMVRNVVGDDVAAQIASIAGEDSAKLEYYLGNNANKLAQIQEAIAGGNGMKAAALVGRFQAQLSAKPTSKKVSSAPPPDTTLSGDAPVNEGGDWQKRFDKADKGGNVQEMLKIKREAEKAGVTVH